MRIENNLPFVIVVSTYDVRDFVYWVPFQTRSIAPGTMGVIPAHDEGRCKLKIELIDGPRTWVLDRPDEQIYSECDVIRIGQPQPSSRPSAAPMEPVATALAG